MKMIDQKKLLKHTVSLEDIMGAMSLKRRREIENGAKYYLLLLQLRDTRKKKGMTQQALADKMHMPRTMITKIESGNRNVTVKTLINIAQAMGKELVIEFR
jgi:DNA-binding XRE family transcriptional regulator